MGKYKKKASFALLLLVIMLGSLSLAQADDHKSGRGEDDEREERDERDEREDNEDRENVVVIPVPTPAPTPAPAPKPAPAPVSVPAPVQVQAAAPAPAIAAKAPQKIEVPKVPKQQVVATVAAPTMVTETVMQDVILADSDRDGILDEQDAYPHVPQMYMVADENNNGLVDTFENMGGSQA